MLHSFALVFLSSSFITGWLLRKDVRKGTSKAAEGAAEACYKVHSLVWSAYANMYGIAYYTYQGNNSDGNYAEAYTKFGYASDYGQTELNFWYSWDYFGYDTGHVISMIAHTFELAPNHAIRASFDISNSLDGNKFQWDEAKGDKSYHHYRLAYQTSYEGFGIEVAAENTSLDYDYADERIVLAISRTFDL